MTPAPTRRVLRLPEICSLVGMSRSWVFREVAAGNFPRPIKIGGASRWDSAQIEAYIATLLDAGGA